jgi:hypothetical protein
MLTMMNPLTMPSVQFYYIPMIFSQNINGEEIFEGKGDGV